jgi:hypothetical protein
MLYTALPDLMRGKPISQFVGPRTKITRYKTIGWLAFWAIAQQKG